MSVKNGRTSSRMIILSRLSNRRSMHSRAFSRVCVHSHTSYTVLQSNTNHIKTSFLQPISKLDSSYQAYNACHMLDHHFHHSKKHRGFICSRINCGTDSFTKLVRSVKQEMHQQQHNNKHIGPRQAGCRIDSVYQLPFIHSSFIIFFNIKLTNATMSLRSLMSVTVYSRRQK